jgi:hypothetical protein
VPIDDYREALLAWLTDNAQESIAQAQAELTIVELRFRLADRKLQAHQRIVDGVMAESGDRDPMKLHARDCNRLAEQHYRETLRRQNLHEARELLREDALALLNADYPELSAMVRYGVRVQDPVRFLDSVGERLVADELTTQEVATVLNLLLLLSTLEAEHNSQCRA